METDYRPEGWQVSTTTLLVEDGNPSFHLGLEVLAVDEATSEPMRSIALQGPITVYGDHHNAALRSFADQLAERYGAEMHIDAPGLHAALLKLRVPVFGSPPVDWDTLERFLGTAGPSATAMLVAHEVGGELSLPVLILFGTAMTVVLNVVHPSTRALGDVIAHRIRRWGKLPEDQGRERQREQARKQASERKGQRERAQEQKRERERKRKQEESHER